MSCHVISILHTHKQFTYVSLSECVTSERNVTFGLVIYIFFYYFFLAWEKLDIEGEVAYTHVEKPRDFSWLTKANQSKKSIQVRS